MSYLSGNIIPRVYSNFRGVDFRGDEINLVRSPDSLNMWKDYKETESIRTRPEFEMKIPCTNTVYGIFSYKGKLLIHTGTTLRTIDGDTIYTQLAAQPSQAFIYDDIFYIKDGRNYLQYDGNTIRSVVGYIPTTTIARKPMGGGSRYEDVNMLSDYRINSFLADGVSFSFYLDVINIDSDFTPEVTVQNQRVYYEVSCSYADDDEEKKKPIYTDTGRVLDLDYYAIKELIYSESLGVTDRGKDVYCYDEDEENPLFCCFGYKDVTVSTNEYTVDYEEGAIIFNNIPPSPPLTDGQDNVFIKFKKTAVDANGNARYHGIIENCTMLQVFDNRVFFSGNPDYPNMVWNSSLNDPSYVSDLDYYREGMDEAAVKGLVAGNNALWVFREPSDANTTVFYHTPSIDDEYGKIYPSAHSSITTGCVGKAINFNDDIVFFSERGLEGISGDITTEQVVAHRSTLVDRKMTAEPNYKDMVLAEWNGYLMVFIGKKCYLADSRGTFTNENHLEYEWFYWELEHDVRCATVKDEILYIGTDSGVYTLTDNTANVESYWVTALDKFKHPYKLKSTNKRGCVAEATGDVSVYAKLEDTDFEHIGTYSNITDYFVCRIKRKKFKDLQLKFHSTTRFSLETVTMECFVGGYIKR